MQREITAHIYMKSLLLLDICIVGTRVKVHKLTPILNAYMCLHNEDVASQKPMTLPCFSHA